MHGEKGKAKNLIQLNMLYEAFQSAAACKIVATSTTAKLFALINTAGSTTLPRAGFSANVNAVDIAVEANSCRIMFGNTPTATNGFLLTAGSIYRFRNVDLSAMNLIRVSGSDSTCSIQIGVCDRGETSNSSQYSAA